MGVIRSFRNKGCADSLNAAILPGSAFKNPDRIRRILLALNAAKAPEQLNIPGLRFHLLRGRDKGRYAVDASGNWRITFGWDSEDAVDVDLEDYH